MACLALRRTDVTARKSLASGSVPLGYGPGDLRSAYNIPVGGGAGVTVAIVDAFDVPDAEADMAVYRTQFGLPACTTANGCFRKVNHNGDSNSLPSYDQGWAGETSLDLDMVSAVCPLCHILLVEADSSNHADLYEAVDYAAAHAKFVSNSYGRPESFDEATAEDWHFNHPGVVFTAASGDDGHKDLYPAASRYVTAVGATELNRAGNARGWTESAWSGAGSNCAHYETMPTWQAGIASVSGCKKRAVADVSAVGSADTGLAVYQSRGAGGWGILAGTSAAAPIIAAMYALAGTPGPSDVPASYPYTHTGDLYDVTSGSNGTCSGPVCHAGTGWDGPTGLGTPNGLAALGNHTDANRAPALDKPVASGGKVTLSWTDKSNNENSFVVLRRSAANGTMAFLKEVAAPDKPGTGRTVTFVDNAPNPDPYQCYQVVSTDADTTWWSPSHTLCAGNYGDGLDFPVNPLFNSTVSSAGTTLTWQDSSDNELDFIVQKRDAGGSWRSLAIVPTRNGYGTDDHYSYVDTNASACYRIAAESGIGADMGNLYAQCTVPDLLGLTTAQATSRLAALGLSVGTVGHLPTDDSQLSGKVVTQYTSPGTQVTPGTVVNFALGVFTPGGCGPQAC
ncbi:PASTA domain-containing protein [Streptomyces sp. NPDC002516]